jgi:hypothetical protein
VNFVDDAVIDQRLQAGRRSRAGGVRQQRLSMLIDSKSTSRAPKRLHLRPAE